MLWSHGDVVMIVVVVVAQNPPPLLHCLLKSSSHLALLVVHFSAYLGSHVAHRRRHLTAGAGVSSQRVG